MHHTVSCETLEMCSKSKSFRIQAEKFIKGSYDKLWEAQNRLEPIGTHFPCVNYIQYLLVTSRDLVLELSHGK